MERLTQVSSLRRGCSMMVAASLLTTGVALMSGSVRICVEGVAVVAASDCSKCCSDEEPRQTHQPANCCVTETPPAMAPTPQRAPSVTQSSGTAIWLASTGEPEAEHRASACSGRFPRVAAHPIQIGISYTILRC